MGVLQHNSIGSILHQSDWEDDSTHLIGGVADTNIVRTATFVVAANGSPQHIRAQADYVCDGVADNVEIQAALNALTSGRTWIETVQLVGSFTLAASVTLANYTRLDISEASVDLASVVAFGSFIHIFNGITKETANLLPNSGFSVWSVASDTTWGAVVAVSAYTTGSNTVVCTTTNTQNLRVGKNIAVTVGDASLKTCFHTITALTTNTSFTFSLEGNAVAAGAGGAITVYEAIPYGNPGYLTDYACDGERTNYWVKTITITQARVETQDIGLGPPSFYCMRVVKGAVTEESITYTMTKTNGYLADLMGFAGRQIVFGGWVYPTTAASCRLFINDGVTLTYSGYGTINTWTWLEVTATIGVFTSIDRVQVGFAFAGAISDAHYISCPMLSYGSYLGNGNYAPIKNEVIHCVGHITPTHWTGVAVTADTIYRLEGETNGHVPKNAKALSFTFEGTCDTVGGNLMVFRNAIVDPLTFGVILGCPVANKVSYGGTSLVQISPGAISSIYVTKQNPGAWTSVSLEFTEVWL